MFLHQSDPMLLLLCLYTSTKKGEDPGQLFRELYQGAWRHLALPLLKGVRRFVRRIFQLGSLASRQQQNRSRAFGQPILEQARFELLAAYPVDRANPPVVQKIRMLRLQQSILYGKLRPRGAGYYARTERFPLEPISREEQLCLALRGR